MEPMFHPFVLALRSGQIVSPFILFSDRILEKPLEINHNYGLRIWDCGLACNDLIGLSHAFSPEEA